ncbi:hypothetical protein KFL_001430080 [Klebsormidium nitens]|uniref:Uncharacterized protein n=1 Tax=Klebsormidium nitens TaxID=105231 RepID=A0A1Y1HXD4_KLENI|nr:hypothetical protein KFL_001430080 [Klebsormidium nitens]|eukprot:GAQ83305.1 hypothetical protein KFL_001430080 [Klebsormidium nitens]
MDKAPSASWLDAQISLPLQLPRDIQLEYHSPSNWKKVHSHRHIQAAPVSFAYGEGPLQEEDANVLAHKEREVVASRKATKAAHKQAAEESLRVRLARLAKERHAAMQKEAPVLSAAGIVVNPVKPQARAEHPKAETKPGQLDRTHSVERDDKASGQVALKGSREAERRQDHLAQIERMLEKRLQVVEASAAVAERARLWLRGKTEELAQTGARGQSDTSETHNVRQDNEVGPPSGYSQETSLEARLETEFRSSFRDTGSTADTRQTTKSGAQDDTLSFSQNPLPRSVVPHPIVRSRSPHETEVLRQKVEHAFENTAVGAPHLDVVLSPISSSGAFTSDDLRGVKAQGQSEVGSLVNEVGSDLGVLSLEHSTASDEGGWLVGHRDSRFFQREAQSETDAEQSVDRSCPSQGVVRSSEKANGVESLVSPSDDWSSNPVVTSCSLSGVATDGRDSEREDLSLQNDLSVLHFSGESPGGADVTASEADVTARGDDAQEQMGQERVRGGVRKREVFDEHGMGGQFFAAVWRSYSDWERQQGKGWARKQQQAEERRKAQIDHERQLEREARLAAERRVDEAEERRLLQSRQTAEEQRRARAEAERAERAVRELENERLSSAMLARLSEQAAAAGIQVPPLCGCAHATCPLSPRYTAQCADNCEVRRSWDFYQKTLSDLLYAVGLLS